MFSPSAAMRFSMNPTESWRLLIRPFVRRLWALEFHEHHHPVFVPERMVDVPMSLACQILNKKDVVGIGDEPSAAGPLDFCSSTERDHVSLVRPAMELEPAGFRPARLLGPGTAAE